MRIILKPLIHRCDGVVLLIAGAQIPMQKIRHDSKRDWMSTGLCIISSACTLQPVKYLRWHEECWSLAYLSRRYSLFKRLLKSRTHIDLHQTGPVPLNPEHILICIRRNQCLLGLLVKKWAHIYGLGWAQK